MKTNKGFTLLEALITLTIVLFIGSIGSLQVMDYRAKLIFENSIVSFNTALDQASRIALIKKESINIYYYPTAHYLEFLGNNYHRKIYFDEKVKISSINNYRISNLGMIPPKTIIFEDGRRQKKIKIQMSWGKRTNEE